MANEAESKRVKDVIEKIQGDLLDLDYYGVGVVNITNSDATGALTATVTIYEDGVATTVTSA
jgi:hypothetical protein